MRAPPPGTAWAVNGAYVESVAAERVPEGERLAAEDIVLQVSLDASVRQASCKQGESRPVDRETCVYLLKRATTRLLHMPTHVFAVLAAHRWHQHTDRHFATHCASFRRSVKWHAPDGNGLPPSSATDGLKWNAPDGHGLPPSSATDCLPDQPLIASLTSH